MRNAVRSTAVLALTLVTLAHATAARADEAAVRAAADRFYAALNVMFTGDVQPRLLVMDHGSDKDDDPGRFRVTITFDEQSNGKTVVTLRQLHPTSAQREASIGFGAVEFGNQTLDKLAAHVDSMKQGTMA